MADRSTDKTHNTTLEPFNIGPKGQQIRRCQFVRYGKHPKAGIQCKGNAMRNANTCKTHGGKAAALVGPANGNWKGGVTTTVHGRRGRWTSLLAGPLQDSYIRALQDPDLLALDAEIALIDLRLEELVKRANVRADWDAAKLAYDDLVAAM